MRLRRVCELTELRACRVTNSGMSTRSACSGGHGVDAIVRLSCRLPAPAGPVRPPFGHALVQLGYWTSLTALAAEMRLESARSR